MTKDQTTAAQTATDDTLAGGAIVEAEITLDQAQIEVALKNIAEVQGSPSTSDHPTLTEMRAAIAMIEAENNKFGLEALRHVIERERGTTGELMTEDLQPSGVFEVNYLDIKVTSPVSIEVALTVWCARARRAVLSGIYDAPAEVSHEPTAE